MTKRETELEKRKQKIQRDELENRVLEGNCTIQRIYGLKPDEVLKLPFAQYKEMLFQWFKEEERQMKMTKNMFGKKGGKTFG